MLICSRKLMARLMLVFAFGSSTLLCAHPSITAASSREANAKAPLALVARFKLPAEARGRFDHFGADVKGNRLFLAAESAHEVLVLDLTRGTLRARIRGVEIPHAIIYRESGNRIYVTDGGAGALKIFDGKSYRLIKTIKLRLDADSTAYDPTMRYLYIVNGGEDAHSTDSFVTAIDTNKDVKVGEIKISSPHVEALAISINTSRLYANDTAHDQVDVLNRQEFRFIQNWQMKTCKENFPLAIDDANSRLFVGCRNGMIAVLDSQTGQELEGLKIGAGVDDLIFDRQSKRLYAACGSGEVYVYQQKSADNYQFLGAVKTAPGGRNAIYVPSIHQLYVTAPRLGEVLVFQPR